MTSSSIEEEDEDDSACKVCAGAMILAGGLYLTILLPVLATVFPQEYFSTLIWFWTQLKQYLFPLLVSLIAGYMIQKHVGIQNEEVLDRINEVNETLDTKLSGAANTTVSFVGRVLLAIVVIAAVAVALWIVLSVILNISETVLVVVTWLITAAENFLRPVLIAGGLLLAVLLVLGGFALRGWLQAGSYLRSSGPEEDEARHPDEDESREPEDDDSGELKEDELEPTEKVTESADTDERTASDSSVFVIDPPPENESTSPEKDSTTLLTKTTPSYNIIPSREKLTVNPGDPIELGLFLSGHGPVENNKLQIFSPQGLLDEDSPIQLHLNRRVAGYSEESPPTYELNSMGGCIILPSDAFQPIEERDHGFPLVPSEQMFDQRPFITLDLDVDDAAIPGDYSLPLNFTYGHDGTVSQDCQSIGIHVNSLFERHDRELRLMGILILLLILLMLSLPFFLDIIQIL